MGIQFQISVYDLMSEGRYSVVTRDYPYTRSDLQTFTQALQAIGVLIAVTLVGLLSDYNLYVVLFAINTALCVSPLWPTLANYITEDVAEGCTSFPSWKVTVLIVGVAVAAPLSGYLAQIGLRVVSLSVALGLVALATAGTFWAFPDNQYIIGRIAAFQVITYISRPSLGSAMDYFYTADAACLPNGPHFSMSYYIFIVGLISTVAGLVALAFYQRRLSDYRFRLVLIITSIVQGIAGLSDLILVWRLNVRMGIPDHFAYIAGEAIFEPVVQTLNYVPVTTLLSKACTPGLESTIYALLAGLSNFCGGISELSGAFIYTWAGVTTSTTPCSFDALGWLIIGCHVLSPLIIGTAAAWFIPNTRQDEPLTPATKPEHDDDNFEQVPLEDFPDSKDLEDDFQ